MKQIDLKEFGATAKAMRNIRGKNQGEVALGMETKTPYISDLEKGKVNLSIGQINKLAQELNCNAYLILEPCSNTQ